MPHRFDLRTAANAFGGASPWNLPGAEDAYAMGNRALRAGFLVSARGIFHALASREPDHPELLLALAETELAYGLPKAAEAVLDELSADLSGAPRVQVLRAECALREGRIASALKLGFESSEISPTDPKCRFLSARLFWLGGQEYEAEHAFLSLAGDPETGDRACAWAVLCGWRQNQREELSALLANLRRDDAVCEGLREFGARALGIPWEPNQLVEPAVRRARALEWEALHRRETRAPHSPTIGAFDPRLG
jgi:tetratricopeptide (TPR) repeat protein